MTISGKPYTARERGIAGFVSGNMVAALFSAYAAFAWYINGGTLDPLGVSLGSVMLIYFLWGSFTGYMAGVLFPITENEAGAFALGGFTLGSGYAITSVAMGKGLNFSLVFVVLGVIAGGIGGIVAFGRHWKSVNEEKGPNGGM